MNWDWLAHFVYLKHVEVDVLQSLKIIEIEMVKTDISIRRSKTIGNALTIVGTLAAPFTFGTSLLATGAGIGLNVASTLGESALLSFYIEKAKEELEKYSDIAEKLNSWTIDNKELAITVLKAVINGAFLDIIRIMIPKTTLELIKHIPESSFIHALLHFQFQIKSFVVDITSNFSIMAISTTSKACAKQISSELSENIAKLASKKALIAVMSFSIIIDVVDIYRIWSRDRPKAIKQVQDAIKQLEENSQSPIYS